MATDTKLTNNHGNDSSGTSSPQSPLAQRGGSEDFYSKGSVNTDFDSIGGENADNDAPGEAD